MPSPLPKPVADYFAASNASDFLRLEHCFAENAVVRDEGREHCGPKAIAAWHAQTQQDSRYQTEILGHHGQALLLTQRLDPGADPYVVALARQIADGQRTELGMLLGWLRLAGAPVTGERPMAWMPAPGGHDHAAAAAPHEAKDA